MAVPASASAAGWSRACWSLRRVLGLVTGASSGIGLHTALGLIKRGQGGRIVEGKSFRLADEVRYIQRRAADYDSRIVTIGQLLNPLGIKSVGEGGINGVGAVIAAAIDEAVGLPGAVTRLPATPQPIKALLRAAAQRGRPAAVEG